MNLKQIEKEMKRRWRLAMKNAKLYKPDLADKHFSEYYKLRSQKIKMNKKRYKR